MIYMIYEKKLKARRVGEWEGRDQRREKKKKRGRCSTRDF